MNNQKNNIAPSYKLIVLASLGAGLEWFDFAIYLLLASVISYNFFPHGDSVIALMNTFATFALGYLARPIGGIIFGHIGDKFGRKPAFTLSVFLMACTTLLIGLTPSYAHIGIWATALLVLFRLLQGFSVGGEISSATVFTLEHFKARKPGLAVGIIFMSLTFGNALAGCFIYVLNHFLTQQQLFSWGWRIPFVFGFALGIVSYWVRKACFETPDFIALQAQRSIQKTPLAVVLTAQWKRMLVSLGLPAMAAATCLYGKPA